MKYQKLGLITRDAFYSKMNFKICKIHELIFDVFGTAYVKLRVYE